MLLDLRIRPETLLFFRHGSLLGAPRTPMSSGNTLGAAKAWAVRPPVESPAIALTDSSAFALQRSPRHRIGSRLRDPRRSDDARHDQDLPLAIFGAHESLQPSRTGLMSITGVPSMASRPSTGLR